VSPAWSTSAEVLLWWATGVGIWLLTLTSFAWPETQRALAVLAISISPGSYVVDVDPDSGEMTVHSLASGRPRMDEVVSR
jgi:multisubunit Na+/H+ antiporter MnhE subunit